MKKILVSIVLILGCLCASAQDNPEKIILEIEPSGKISNIPNKEGLVEETEEVSEASRETEDVSNSSGESDDQKPFVLEIGPHGVISEIK